VSLRGFRLVLFLEELNHLQIQIWATDIGNAYLEAYTSEKVYVIAGPEFKDREVHILIISKALYGLRSSGARWHDRFADCVRELGFFPCKAEPDIWMRQKGNSYEYVAVYVDDLAIAKKDPKEFTYTLEKKHKFKLKGTGLIAFYLVWTSIEIGITYCASHQPNTLTSRSRIMRSYLV
jgi:Reverse transcriptase (RNA-dependent DNA polymerase)